MPAARRRMRAQKRMTGSISGEGERIAAMRRTSDASGIVAKSATVATQYVRSIGRDSSTTRLRYNLQPRTRWPHVHSSTHIKEKVVSDTLTATAVLDEPAAAAAPIVNDLTIHVATVNGSGSQSSNNVLMRSIFQMGVPVSGKNMFPSNIAGLPTWFTIRANKDGWIARKKEVDIMVCMNAQTAREDVEALTPGSLCIYDAPLNCKSIRNDVQFFEVPFSKLAMEIADDARMRKLLTNMIYVGVVAELLGIERGEILNAISKQFKGKKKAIDPNVAAIDKGIEFAQNNLPKQSKWRITRMNKTAGKIIIDGNAAAAIGAIFGGVTVVTWYPITPSSSLCESIIEYARQHRIEKDGRANFAIVQAEDELAAIRMVLGAGWAGARSMTSTAGPGISLM